MVEMPFPKTIDVGGARTIAVVRESCPAEVLNRTDDAAEDSLPFACDRPSWPAADRYWCQS